jgi:hypothetical protein
MALVLVGGRPTWLLLISAELLQCYLDGFECLSEHSGTHID